MGPRDKAGGAVSQLLCLGSKGRGLLQATLNFPNRVSGWEGLGSTLSHGYKLILLPTHSRGTLHAQYWFCSEGNQFCLPACLSARALLSCTASRYFHYPLDHMWLGVTLHSRCGCDSAPWLRVGKPGSRADKTPYLRIWISQICTPPSSLVRVHHQLGSADEQSHPLIWITTWALQVWNWSAKICALVSASPSPFSITIRFLVFEPHRFPCNPYEARSE